MALVMKIFALYALVQALQHSGFIGVLFHPALEGPQTLLLVSALLPFSLLLLIAALFWFKAKKFKDEQLNLNMDTDKLQVVLFSFAGLLLICHALPLFFGNIAAYATYHSTLAIGDTHWVQTWTVLTIKLVLGFVLLFGSKGISRMVSITRGQSIKA